MSLTISISHRDRDADQWLHVDIHSVSLDVQVSEFPKQMREIAPGVTEILQLHRGNVLVLRELHRTGDADAQDSEDTP